VLYDIISGFERDQVDIVYSGITYVNPKYEIIGEWASEELSLGSFSDSWYPPHSGFFVRKACYGKAGGFDLNFKVTADFGLMYRFLETSEFKSSLLSRLTVNIRNDENSRLLDLKFMGF
jgi:glycosyltransferase|tara:strand:- start:5507 stop:5863 length:357 start_codon:yes stop_codon:yes gene_type:complete